MPETVELLLDWLKKYKTTDGKGLLPRVMNTLSMPSQDSKKD